MSAKQRGLGRGLGALIGDFQEEPESGAVTKLPLQKVEPNPDQPRRTFDEEELQALADSIAVGPLLVPGRSAPAAAGRPRKRRRILSDHCGRAPLARGTDGGPERGPGRRA